MTEQTNFITDRQLALLKSATEIVASYVSSHHLEVQKLPGFIGDVHAAVTGLIDGVAPASAAEPTTEQPTAAQIRKSITPDALISFVDGKPYKTLKRHLTKHGLDIHSYRARYGLPADYPSTSANYSAERSKLAKAIGLGQPGRLAA